jgi:O-antigen ligase
LWEEVDKSIAMRPLLGYGYQTFWTPVSSENWRIAAATGWGPPHAHNGYRDTILSLGFVGAAVLRVRDRQGASQGARLEFREPDEGWFWLNVLFGMFLTMNLTKSLILWQNEFFWTMFMTYLLMFSLRSPSTAPYRRYPGSSVRRRRPGGDDALKPGPEASCDARGIAGREEEAPRSLRTRPSCARRSGRSSRRRPQA